MQHYILYRFSVNQIIVTAIEDDTNVRLLLRNGITHDVSLQKYTSANFASAEDCTGTLVTANKPIDVLGAASCVEVPPTRVSRGATDE